MGLLKRSKVKARRVKETYFTELYPHHRKFGKDIYELHATKKKKGDAQALAGRLRAKGHYTRVTYNKGLKRWFVWRG